MNTSQWTPIEIHRVPQPPWLSRPEDAAPKVPETHPASRLYRVFTGLFVFGPPALLVAAFWRRWLFATRTNRRIFGVFYLLSGLGITAGYHRLFTHRSFKTYPLIRGALAVLGSTAIQGSAPDWVADHRKHTPPVRSHCGAELFCGTGHSRAGCD